MPKFSGPNNNRTPRSIISTTPVQTPTHESGDGYLRTARSELFLQAVAEMAENTFYETAEDRRKRLSSNIAQVITEPDGWDWICNLTQWLRNDGNMRSVSIMIAAEAVAALKGSTPKGVTTPRQLIASACMRADEPGEMLGYWLQFHGRNLPAPVKRGIADAASRLYNERNTLKYDGQSRAIRMGDVCDLTHPKPSDPDQSRLFSHLIDRRHNREGIPSSLSLLLKDEALQSLPVEQRRAALPTAIEAGWSWERLAGWLPGGMDAEAWESIIPNMGYMALIRNLRNFDQAGISAATEAYVATRLSDPEEVSRSKQFPYRFLSAHKAVTSLNWGKSLESALGHSIQNIPVLPGRTLILVDTSGSMQSPVGGERSQAQRWEVAALFAGAIAVRNSDQDVDVAIYATYDKRIGSPKNGASILRYVKEMNGHVGSVGHGTNTWGAIGNNFAGHDRIIVLTDEQSHDHGKNPGTFLHFINLAGYQPSTAAPDPRTFSYGGFTDAMFRTIPLLESGAAGRWPWK